MTEQKKLRLALIYGGQSGEHEVSLASAFSVLQALDTKQYDITPIAIDKKGQWFSNEWEELVTTCQKRLVVKGKKTKKVNFSLDFFNQFDVAFPVMHGPLYEDGCIQGLFDIAGIAYVGSGCLASSMAMDKDITKRLVQLEGIRTARHLTFYKANAQKEKKEAFCQQAIVQLNLPLFVKPACLGSSVALHKVYNFAELIKAVDNALHFDEKIMVEEFIDGQEVELAVLGARGKTKVSGSGEIYIKTTGGFYSYDAKYVDDSQVELKIPADIREEQEVQLQTLAKKIFLLLECDGLARVDFFVEKKSGQVVFNEINTLPGFTTISMYPKLWQASGMRYSFLLDELILLGIERFKRRQQLVKDNF